VVPSKPFCSIHNKQKRKNTIFDFFLPLSFSDNKMPKRKLPSEEEEENSKQKQKHNKLLNPAIVWIQIPEEKEGSSSYWLTVAPQRKPDCPAYGDECRLPLPGAERGHCSTDCSFPRSTERTSKCTGCSNGKIEHRWVCLNCDAPFCELCFIIQKNQFGRNRFSVSRFLRSLPRFYPRNVITRGLKECTACVATIRCFGCLTLYQTSDPEHGCGNCVKQLISVLMDAVSVFPLDIVKLILMLLLIERDEWFRLQLFDIVGADVVVSD
jgi:hypothetical protein